MVAFNSFVWLIKVLTTTATTTTAGTTTTIASAAYLKWSSLDSKLKKE